MEKQLVNVNEAAAYMGLSKNTLYSWVCQRKIPFVKCGRLTRFNIRDIEQWIVKHTVKVNDFDVRRIL